MVGVLRVCVCVVWCVWCLSLCWGETKTQGEIDPHALCVCVCGGGFDGFVGPLERWG